MKKLLLCLIYGSLLLVCDNAEAQQRIAASYPGIAGYNIPFWVALDTGEFKKLGLEVDPVLISGGSKSMQALLSGGLDFAHTSGGVPVQASLSGADVIIIGTAANSMSAGVIAAKEIRSYQDLKGELGLDHFEGRSYRGWQHHITCALACYAFLVAERAGAFPPSARGAQDDHTISRAA